MTEIEERANIRKEIDQILWVDWDPIGMNGIGPRDEYQSYVQQILQMTLTHSSVEEVADRLHYIEIQILGVDGNKDHCREIALKIKYGHANKV